MIDPQKQMNLVASRPLDVPELIEMLRIIQWRLSWYDKIDTEIPQEQQESIAAILYYALETAIKMIEDLEQATHPDLEGRSNGTL